MILSFQGKTPKVHESCFVAPDAWIIGDVTLEENVSVFFGSVLRGDIQPIVVKKGSNVQEHSLIHTSGGRSPAIVGENVTVGHKAIIHGCTVENGCLIGMGAIVLDDAVVGEESLVAAGCVVKERTQIPRRSLVAGVPGQILRELNDEQVKGMHAGTKGYIATGKRYVEELKAQSIGADRTTKS